MTRHTRTLLALAAAVGFAACGKSDEAYTDTTTPASATEVKAFEVGDIDMGKSIDAEKKIADKTDDFAPTDTIYASIHTTGGSAPTQLSVRWTFQDSTVVNEETQTVAAGADANTEFHISKPGGFPKGTYTIHVTANGQEVKTKDITVK